MEVVTTMDTLTPRPQTSSTADPDTLVQLLDPEGRRLDHSRYDAWISDLGPAELRGLYRDMVLARRFDAEATALQRQGELSLWPPSLGQEAAQVGSGRAMRPQDFVFPSYREHAVAHTRGMDMRELLRVFRGVEHGGWDPAAHNFHLYTFVIGSHTLHATGYAMAAQRDGDVGTGDAERDRAVVVYFGDGATSQGDVHEAMVFAAVTKAPVVFICQNNQWAISVPTSGQATVPLARRGAGVGIPSVRVDGNDVLASYAVSRMQLDEARAGGGPRAIEAVTYRMGAHTTSDDPTKNRGSAEEQEWALRDPIARMRAFLENRGASAALFADVDAEAADAAEDLRARSVVLPEPGPDTIFTHVYSEPHPLLDEQRRWLADYEASFEGGVQ